MKIFSGKKFIRDNSTGKEKNLQSLDFIERKNAFIKMTEKLKSAFISNETLLVTSKAGFLVSFWIFKFSWTFSL